MKLSKKIFLAVFGSSSLAGLAVGIFFYEHAHELRKNEYLHDYDRQIHLLGSSFQALERTSDTLSSNAAKAFYEWEKDLSKLPAEADLANLAKELGVAHLAIVDQSGAFIRATDGSVGKKNLFSFCSGYKDLLTGQNKIEQTPVIPAEMNGQQALYKFTIVPNYNHTQLLVVSVDFSFVSRFIQSLVDKDHNLQRVDLLASNGRKLGTVVKTGADAIPNQTEVTSEEDLKEDWIDWQPDHLLISEAIPSSVSNCCECRVKNLVSSEQKFGYHLMTYVSLDGFQQDIQQLRWRMGIAMLFIIALSLGIAQVLTNLILRKLRRISGVVEEVSSTGDFSRAKGLETNVASGERDEIDSLAERFTQMFASLRESQEKLLESKRAEAKASIAAQVAHDIRSPLTSMGLALAQLRKQISPSTAGTQESFAAVASGIERVTGIVKKLSADYSKEEQNPDSVETPRLTMVDQILGEVAQEHQIKLKTSDRFVVQGFEQPPRIWGVVQVNEIQTAFSNLLNNAFEATNEEQKVTFTIRTEGKKLILTVEDQGVGIPEENLARIFERKFTSGKKHGSGLGLYQAKQAIEWSDGSIQVESTPNVGTRFTITLPLEKTPSWIAHVIPWKPGQELIVADDDPSMIERWKNRVATSDIPASYYPSLSALKEAYPNGLPASKILVIDQNLGDGTGLDYIAQYSLQENVYLCTSAYDEKALQDEIRKRKIKLIPKPWIETMEFKKDSV